MSVRLATAALSGRIFAGTPNKAGDGFKGQRHDVTSDALKCVSEHIGMNNRAVVHCDGKPAFEIAVTPIARIDARKDGVS